MKMKFLILINFVIVSSYGQLNPIDCGLGTLSPNKIVGGTVASKGNWGWQVALKQFDRVVCGGVLLNSHWVVTAAHCVPTTESAWPYLDVDIGFSNLQVADPWSTNKKISKIFIHEGFNKRTKYSDDIALLKLESPVTLDDVNHRIVAACVPTPNESFANKEGWVTGYGSLFSGGSISSLLRQVNIPIMDENYCENRYDQIDSSRQLCAGYIGLGKDTCQGDSGGPLASKGDDGVWYVVGITSYGPIPCGEGGVYTRLSGYNDWMLEKMELN